MSSFQRWIHHATLLLLWIVGTTHAMPSILLQQQRINTRARMTQTPSPRSVLPTLLSRLRGGEQEAVAEVVAEEEVAEEEEAKVEEDEVVKPKKKKKKKKNKAKKAAVTGDDDTTVEGVEAVPGESKNAIAEAMEKDSAQAMGDVIRYV